MYARSASAHGAAQRSQGESEPTMPAPDNPEGCAAFRGLPPNSLKPRTIHRMIVGVDAGIQELTQDVAARQLGDPFATLLLLNGTFPNTAGDVLTALDKVTKAGDLLRERFFFFVGEATQIPGTEKVDRHLRFLVTTGFDPDNGPDLMLSAFHPDSEDTELMAWDRKSGGFNYYRTVDGSDGWIFAGNSRHAVEPPSEFKGPFETHVSGNFVMKELKLPWIHWHSFSAPVSTANIPKDLRTHPWFTKKDSDGAATCEIQAAIPSIERWTRRRFELILGKNGIVERPARVMRHVLATDTVNLHTSTTASSEIGNVLSIDLPPTFFVDADSLGALKLRQPEGFTVPSKIYAETLQTFNVRLTDGARFMRPGDTHFCFCVPERAFEDVAVLREALRVGLFGERFAASLLMVDFANPVFSPRRAKLLEHVPPTATVKDGKSGFAPAMVKRILAAAEGSQQNSPEREFEKRWQTGGRWRSEFNRLLENYYKGAQRTIKTQAGFDGVFRVAETRRNDVRRQTPLVESPLLFATTNIPNTTRMRMRFDGTTAEA
jgi:hypothetical protein